MNDKPILIDALHICMGGGLAILNHLVNNLISRNVNFVLLKDSRCPTLQEENKVKRIEVLKSSFGERQRYYNNHQNDFRSVLCFGNIPPYVRLNVPVHTYMHNVSLLKIPKDYSIKRKISSYLKRAIILHYAKNTSDWIVQTSNTANLVKSILKKENQKVLGYPFYYIPEQLSENVTGKRTDYVFVGDYTNAKGHEYLIEAWIKLHRMGVNPVLHLTVTDLEICKYINDARAEGATIVNHGIIPFNEVFELYKKSKATVYPSLNESLGLGIIEAMESGCDVIGCDLPYMHSVCRPSCTFAPRNSQQIVDAIIKYETGGCSATQPLIRDKVNDFITFLTQ